MATIASMYEEKLSPKLDDPYKRTDKDLGREKIDSLKTENKVDVDDEGKSDAVLEEIAAKVNALDFDNDDNDPHLKCKGTVREQGETIRTLVNQLHFMFQEYVEVNSEREYYEDLNDALLLCLEIKEGKLEIQDDLSEDEQDIKNLDCKEKDGPHIVIKPTNSDACSDVEQEETPKYMEQGDGSSTETGAKVSEKSNEQKSKNPKENTSELKRLNRILLGEIFELRHQMEVMKEHFREYINPDDLLSTATDDEYDTESED